MYLAGHRPVGGSVPELSSLACRFHNCQSVCLAPVPPAIWKHPRERGPGWPASGPAGGLRTEHRRSSPRLCWRLGCPEPPLTYGIGAFLINQLWSVLIPSPSNPLHPLVRRTREWAPLAGATGDTCSQTHTSVRAGGPTYVGLRNPIHGGPSNGSFRTYHGRQTLAKDVLAPAFGLGSLFRVGAAPPGGVDTGGAAFKYVRMCLLVRSVRAQPPAFGFVASVPEIAACCRNGCPCLGP